MSSMIDLDYLQACRLLLPSTNEVDITLIGCGGTGSWLAPSIVRVARLLQEKFQKCIRVTFVDPDQVEQKNCYRQNFCLAEVGHNKAEALATRYGLAWGVPVTWFPQPFRSTQNHQNELKLYIGCVDNAEARKAICKAVAGHYSSSVLDWWLDCGNHKAAGQVLLGCGHNRPARPFELTGFCSWLPLPSQQHPELLTLQPETQTSEEGLSCADLAMLDSQGLAINQRIAAEATDYLVRMLLTRDLHKFATYVDLVSGAARSRYITPASVSTETVDS
ncbi:MAG: PRTRC system ThiF family protein [Anaerolineaceae bacterium]|nr:PRTRC system ThiF family protein [Anaerolineaceae bacterium]